MESNAKFCIWSRFIVLYNFSNGVCDGIFLNNIANPEIKNTSKSTRYDGSTVGYRLSIFKSAGGASQEERGRASSARLCEALSLLQVPAPCLLFLAPLLVSIYLLGRSSSLDLVPSTQFLCWCKKSYAA